MRMKRLIDSKNKERGWSTAETKAAKIELCYSLLPFLIFCFMLLLAGNLQNE